MVDVAARLKASLAALASGGPPAGRAWCQAWTAEVDAGLVELHAGLEITGRLAVVATGGFGRRELCPGSDIDLLLVYDRVGHEGLEGAVRQIVYPLWDAGLTVGHAVRDHRQAVSMALDDPEVATTLLDARLVAGDLELFRAARDELVRRLRRKPKRFLTALADADRDRRLRVGDAAEVLEPDLKRGAGGLRDVQSLRWAAAALLGEVALDPLVSAGYLGAPDRAELARAYDRLVAVRVALHLEAERPTDVLRMDLQQRVALRLGYEDGADERDTAAHRLLRDLFLAARRIDHVHRRAWALLEADANHGRRLRRPVEIELDGFGIVDGVLQISDEIDLHDPSLPTRLLRVLADTGSVLDRVSAARLARAVAARAEPYAWDAASRSRLLAVLWWGTDALSALAELDDVGLFGAMIPEWEPLRGRPQRNPLHRYSVDRHALHTAAELGELVRSEAWATEVLEFVEDRDGLMLGALLHDVGKAYGEPHSVTGVAVADAIVERLGSGTATRELVGRMVRHHLLLPDAATRRDLSDPGLPAAVAADVGDRQTLACLHLLAVADARATGPGAWSSWKASLVNTLVRKVAAVLDETHPDDLADGAVATARDAQGLAEDLGVDPATVRAHLALLPPRYAAAVSPRTVVRHAALAARPLGPAEVRTRVTPGSSEEVRDGEVRDGEVRDGKVRDGEVRDGEATFDDLEVVAVDRPGLFAKVAGVLALHGGSVVAAHAYTRTDGVAVDTFTVQRPAASGGSWWATVEGDLVEAVAGRLALRARVAHKATSRRPRRMPDVQTRVEVVADASGQASIVEVRVADRPGVLFAIVSALAELELDIVAAKIDTLGHEAVDAFYVRDSAGSPLDDHHAREVVLAVEASLAPFVVPR